MPISILLPTLSVSLIALFVAASCILGLEYALNRLLKTKVSDVDKLQIGFIGLFLRIPAYAAIMSVLYFSFCPYIEFLALLSLFCYFCISVPLSLRFK